MDLSRLVILPRPLRHPAMDGDAVLRNAQTPFLASFSHSDPDNYLRIWVFRLVLQH